MAKWLPEEALYTAEKRREVKSKGETKRYSHLNAEYQRIARKDEKAFLTDQCKEIEENNRMGKTRDLFKRIRDTKGRFHAKMCTIKDRNSMDLTEAKDNTDTLCQDHLHPFQNLIHTDLSPDLFGSFSELSERLSLRLYFSIRQVYFSIDSTQGFYMAIWGVFSADRYTGCHLKQRSLCPHGGSTLIHQPVSPLNSPFGALCKFHYTGRLIQSLVTGDWFNL